MDEANNQLTVQADTEGSDPLQRCLRGSAHGERVPLIAYTLPANRRAQPERAGRCSFTPTPTGYLIPGRYPPGLTHSQQVVAPTTTGADRRRLPGK